LLRVDYKPILLTGLLCCSVSGAHARGPYALFGLGTLKCLVFVNMETDKDMKPLGDEAFAWAQAWFSARNVVGRATALTVGGTLSSDTLESMLVDKCRDSPKVELWYAVDGLYNHLAEKGM
jgi:hypothetical protein